jgi:hypothetical protein
MFSLAVIYCTSVEWNDDMAAMIEPWFRSRSGAFAGPRCPPLALSRSRPVVWYRRDCVAKLFSPPKCTTLIQELEQARNLESRHHLIGFDYCVFAAQHRVLQQNPPNSGRIAAAHRMTGMGHKQSSLFDRLLGLDTGRLDGRHRLPPSCAVARCGSGHDGAAGDPPRRGYNLRNTSCIRSVPAYLRRSCRGRSYGPCPR